MSSLVWFLAVGAFLLALWSLKTAGSLKRRLGRQEAELRSSELRWKDWQEQQQSRIDTLQLFLGGMAEGRTATAEQIREGGLFRDIEGEVAHRLLDQPATVFIDVREPYEYQTGHVPGAQLIPMSQIEQRWSEIPSSVDRVVVHCASGNRSTSACHFLSQEKGYLNLYNLSGGLAAWPGPLEQEGA